MEQYYAMKLRSPLRRPVMNTLWLTRIVSENNIMLCNILYNIM